MMLIIYFCGKLEVLMIKLKKLCIKNSLGLKE